MNIQVYTLPEALNGLGSTSQPRTSIDLNFNFQSALATFSVAAFQRIVFASLSQGVIRTFFRLF